MIELAKLRGTMINMIIYDPSLHKVEEIYTDPSASLNAINNLIQNPKEPPGIRKRRRYLKFESHPAE